MGMKSSRVSARWPRMAIVGCMQDDCLGSHGGGGGQRVRGHAAAFYETVAWVAGGRPMTQLCRPRGVLVVLPVRDGSPGGSYGTAVEGRALRPAMFPVEVRLAGQGPQAICSRPRWMLARRS
jgi:hypothetical protein